MGAVLKGVISGFVVRVHRFFFSFSIVPCSYSPTVQTTVVDFTVTQKGLEEQLLGGVIQKEQKSLEEQLNNVLEEVGRFERDSMRQSRDVFDAIIAYYSSSSKRLERLGFTICFFCLRLECRGTLKRRKMSSPHERYDTLAALGVLFQQQVHISLRCWLIRGRTRLHCRVVFVRVRLKLISASYSASTLQYIHTFGQIIDLRCFDVDLSGQIDSLYLYDLAHV